MFIKSLYKWVVTGFTGLCLSLSAFAGPEMSTDDRWLLAKYDVNGDKVISVDEVEEKRRKMFSGLDIDANGGVSFNEYQEVDAQKRAQLLKARFSRLDLNQDGVLTNAEYSSYLGSFERFDSNGDGNISSAEIDRTRTSKPPARVTNAKDSLCLLWLCVRKSLH